MPCCRLGFLLLLAVTGASAAFTWDDNFGGECVFLGSNFGNCIEYISKIQEIYTDTYYAHRGKYEHDEYEGYWDDYFQCKRFRGPVENAPWSASEFWRRNFPVARDVARFCLGENNAFVQKLSILNEASAQVRNAFGADGNPCMWTKAIEDDDHTRYQFGSYCACDWDRLPSDLNAVKIAGNVSLMPAFKIFGHDGSPEPVKSLDVLSLRDQLVFTNTSIVNGTISSRDFYRTAFFGRYSRLFLSRFDERKNVPLNQASIASVVWSREVYTVSDAADTPPPEGDNAWHGTLDPVSVPVFIEPSAWDVISVSPATVRAPGYLVDMAAYREQITSDVDPSIPAPNHFWPDSAFETPFKLSDLSNHLTAAFIWCDAPRSVGENSRCSTNLDLNQIDGVGRTRGCGSYGRCPIGPNGKTCSGQGRCLSNGKCFCNFSNGTRFTVGEYHLVNFTTALGDACEFSTPTWNMSSNPDTFDFSQLGRWLGETDERIKQAAPAWLGRAASWDFDRLLPYIAGSRGICKRSGGWFKCRCFGAWTGNPENPDHLQLYRRVFFAQDRDYSTANITVPSDTGPDVTISPVQIYLALHQCGVWLGADNGPYEWFDVSAGNLIQYPNGKGDGRYRVVHITRQPTWIIPEDLRVVIDYYDQFDIDPATQTAGYRCIDERRLTSTKLDNNREPILYGTIACVECPICGHGRCVLDTAAVDPADADQNLTALAYCECDYNFALDPTTADAPRSTRTCSKQICPRVGQDLPCGTHGRCVVASNSSTGTVTPVSDLYIGQCICDNGFEGDACETQISGCPLRNGLVCSGHGTCDTATRACVCDSGWLNNANGSCIAQNQCSGGSACFNGCTAGACEHRDCPYNCMNRLSRTGNSVCERNEEAPYCRCQDTWSATDPTDIANSWFGPVCNLAYSDTWVCRDENHATCSSAAGAQCRVADDCVGVNTAACQAARPQCRCPENRYGTFCQNSRCPATAPFLGYDCDFADYALGIYQPGGTCAGFCGSERSLGGECREGVSKVFRCVCDALDLSNSYTKCSSSHQNESCAVFGSASGDDAGGCTVAKLGCTYYNATKRRYTLCDDATRADGVAVCAYNSSSSSYYCSCPPNHNGTYCEHPVGCAALCSGDRGGTCDVLGNCLCRGAFWGGSYCLTNTCNTTGGVFNESSTHPDLSTCNCTGANTAHYPASINAPGKDYTGLKGCFKLCPASTHGECGTRSVKRCNNTVALGGRPVYANETTSVACNCSIPAASPRRSGVVLVRWIADSTYGCTEYCVNGTDPMTGPCNCSGTPFQGERCDTLACGNDGLVVNGTCQCIENVEGVEYPWTVASNCTEHACGPHGNYSGGPTCDCVAPYVKSTNASSPWCINPCIEGQGTPNITSGSCECVDFFTGENCETPMCVEGSVDFEGDTCTCLNSTLTWNTTLKRCVFEGCVHGTATANGHCLCERFWTGSLCDTDVCATHNGTATFNSTSEEWYCACKDGYDIPDGSQLGLCTETSCFPGYAYPCNPTFPNRCIYPAFGNFNCECGRGQWFVDAVCIPSCAAGQGTLDIDRNTGKVYCRCFDGFSGDQCTVARCNATNSRWNVTTKVCECVPPFQGINCTATSCGAGGIGVKAVNGSSTLKECVCGSGYRLKLDAGHSFSDGYHKCVLACSPTGTVHASDTKCVCASGFFGTLCDSQAVVPTRKPSVPIEPWEIAVTIIGFILAVIGVLAVYNFLWLRRPFAWRSLLPSSSSVKTTGSSTAGRAWRYH